MSITPPTQGPGPPQPSNEGETTATPPASQQEVQNIAREALSAEPTSSGYLPKWMTNVASYAASNVKTLYHTYFDPKYAEAYSDIESGNRAFTRLETVLHANPQDLELLRYCFSTLNNQRSTYVLYQLFESKSLTVTDLDSIGRVAPRWSRDSIHAIMQGFFREPCDNYVSLSLMEAFCAQFKHEFIDENGFRTFPQNAITYLNNYPPLLKVFLKAYSSVIGNNIWMRKEVCDGLLDCLGVADSFPDPEALKIYCDLERDVPMSGLYDKAYILLRLKSLTNPLKMCNAMALEGLEGFVHQNSQHADFIVKILAFYLASCPANPDLFDSDRSGVSKSLSEALFSLRVPLRPFFSDQEWEKLEALYLKVFPNGPIFTLNELEKSAVLSGFEFSTRASIEFSAVAAKVLTEAQAKDPRFLMAIAFYQWAERRGGVDEMLTISHEEKEVTLPPMLALGWLNRTGDITWEELKAPVRTIECELDGKRGSATPSAFDQKLLKDNSEYFSRYLANRWQAGQSPIQNIAPGAIEDLVKYIADSSLTFEDVDAAAEMLAIADMFQVPSVFDRAVTWLNTYADSLETQEERKSFADSLRHEDSPLYNNHAILERLNLPGS